MPFPFPRPLLLLFFAFSLSAQTSIPPNQIRQLSDLTISPGNIRLYAVDPTKQGVIQVKPGAGLVLRSTPEGWVLESTAVALPLLLRRVLSRDPFGNYPAPVGAEIFRNGLLMTEGVDYNRDATSVIPLRGPWVPEDIVISLVVGSEPLAAIPPKALTAKR
jgi:hypothetical protein